MRRRKSKKRLILWTLAVIALLLIGGVIFFGMKRAFTYEAPEIEHAGQAVHAVPTPTPRPTGSGQVQRLTEPLSILLIGVDSVNGISEESRGNADGIIVATINPDTKQMVFTSFMRDTRVRVRDSGYDKLTNVFHVGGPELLVEVLEQNFDIPIDYHAMFTYTDVVDIVEAVGGVEIDLTVDEIYYMEPKIRGISSETGTNYEDNALNVDQAGLLTLNGVQAAAYTRIRPAEGGYDAGRTERTRDVIAKVLGKAFKLPGSEMLQFANVFFDKMTTNIPNDVFLSLAMSASELRQYTQVSDRIPIDGAYTSGDTGSGFYVIPDFEINNRHLQDSLYKGVHS